MTRATIRLPTFIKNILGIRTLLKPAKDAVQKFLNRLTVCDLEKYLKSVYLAASESDDENTNERAFGKNFAALYFGKGK